MKKWILIISVVLLVIIGYGVYVYFQAVKPLDTAKQKAVTIAKQRAYLVSTQEFYQFNGKESYSVVVGKRKNGTKIAVWIPNSKNKNVTIIKWADGLTKTEAVNKLMEKRKPEKILGVRLGMNENVPVWEISFLDQSKKLNYFYIDFIKTSNHSTLIENI